MKRKVLAVLAIGAVFGLTACENPRVVQEREYVKIGIQCAEAGGNWTHGYWRGYTCEIPK